MAEKVKTYQNVNAQAEELSFGISKMQAIYVKRQGKVDKPPRHNFFTVLLFKNAQGQHKIDFNTYTLDKQQIYFIAPGQVHQVIEDKASTGFSMVFSHQFLVENAIPLSFIERLNLFQNYGDTPPLKTTTQEFEKITDYAEQIFDTFHQNTPYKFMAIGALLKLLLIACNNSCTLDRAATDAEQIGENLIRAFKKSVEQNYKSQHTTAFYAEALHITPDHLNRTLKVKMGKTAKDYLTTRLITEAKRLLYFSDLTNKEIAYHLGFNQPGNFSAFFKNYTKVSPSAFRKRLLKH